MTRYLVCLEQVSQRGIRIAPGRSVCSIGTMAERSVSVSRSTGSRLPFANGGTIGFKCPSPEQAQQFHDVAIAHGGTSIEDPPGLREGKLGPCTCPIYATRTATSCVGCTDPSEFATQAAAAQRQTLLPEFRFGSGSAQSTRTLRRPALSLKLTPSI